MKIFLLFVFVCCSVLATEVSHAQTSAGLDMSVLFTGPDSVVLRARMYTPPGVGFNMWAVTVAIGYDPGLFYVTDARGVMNHFWAAQGWDSDSRPRLDTTSNPSINFYGEAHPTMGVIQINQNASFNLCTFTFFPRSSSPGTANFVIVANRPTAALTGYWISTSSQNQPFSPALNLTNIAFPVEFSAFSATQQGKAVVVQWRTESESGNYGFHVQRRTAEFEDPNDAWETVGFVEGKGDSKVPLDYFFTDGTVEKNGWYEYRLTQQDFDGTTSLSPKTRVLYSNDVSGFTLGQNYPNPVSASAGIPTFLRFGVEERSRVRMIVTNTLGQVVDDLLDFAYDPGTYTLSWTPRGIPAGMYIATMTSESEATGTVNRAVVKMAVMK